MEGLGGICGFCGQLSPCFVLVVFLLVSIFCKLSLARTDFVSILGGGTGSNDDSASSWYCFACGIGDGV